MGRSSPSWRCSLCSPDTHRIFIQVRWHPPCPLALPRPSSHARGQTQSCPRAVRAAPAPARSMRSLLFVCCLSLAAGSPVTADYWRGPLVNASARQEQPRLDARCAAAFTEAQPAFGGIAESGASAESGAADLALCCCARRGLAMEDRIDFSESRSDRAPLMPREVGACCLAWVSARHRVCVTTVSLSLKIGCRLFSSLYVFSSSAGPLDRMSWALSAPTTH